MIALDASALLALLFAEPGHEVVGQQLGRACMSTVNLAEVLGRYQREGQDPHQLLARLQESPLEFVPFTAQAAALCASLIPATQPSGLSLGDRACLALGQLRQIPVLTADRVWTQLNVDVEIRLIR